MWPCLNVFIYKAQYLVCILPAVWLVGLCLFQFRSEVIVTPRYFYLITWPCHQTKTDSSGVSPLRSAGEIHVDGKRLSCDCRLLSLFPDLASVPIETDLIVIYLSKVFDLIRCHTWDYYTSLSGIGSGAEYGVSSSVSARSLKLSNAGPDP